MPIEKAYGIIEERAGTQFDPMIAKAFLDSKYEIEKVIKEYDD